MALENERQIVRDWKNGSKSAFELLVRHYMRDAYLTAYGMVSNVEDAKDLSQDAFVKAWRARESFDDSRAFYPWLYRIVKNHCLNFLTRGRRGESLYFDENPDRERFAARGPGPLDQVEAGERRRVVRAAVNRLSDGHREIIVLKSFKGFSYREIADVLEIPIGTVMSRLYYARRALRDIIEQIETHGVVETGTLPEHGEPAGGVV